MRCLSPLLILGPDGRPLSGASVQTNNRPSGSAATVYAAETAGGAGANPATTDGKGGVHQWLERGAYSSVISHESLETFSVPWDAVPGGDHGIDDSAVTVMLKEHADAVPGLKAEIKAEKEAREAADTSAKSIIATEQSREGAAYGLLPTPDQVTVVLPTDGLIAVAYKATWKNSVGSAGMAAIFIGENQLKIYNVGGPGSPEVMTEAAAGVSLTGFVGLSSAAIGLVSSGNVERTGEDVTTGQALGMVAVGNQGYHAEIGVYGIKEFAQNGWAGGPCYYSGRVNRGRLW
jgi:hypothetical protein